jgi:hypothetical protein
LEGVVYQLGFPADVTAQEIARKQSLGGAISLCAEAAGKAPKEVQDALKTDKAQFSRWTDDKEGILWSKLRALMDYCGNDAPLLWMMHARGYDLHSIRRVESEMERQCRELREELKKERSEREVERRLFKEIRAT